MKVRVLLCHVLCINEYSIVLDRVYHTMNTRPNRVSENVQELVLRTHVLHSSFRSMIDDSYLVDPGYRIDPEVEEITHEFEDASVVTLSTKDSTGVFIKDSRERLKGVRSRPRGF